jgi:hypothetical protein
MQKNSQTKLESETLPITNRHLLRAMNSRSRSSRRLFLKRSGSASLGWASLAVLALAPSWLRSAETRPWVEDNDGGEPREVQGRELLETGLEVAAANPQTALIFTYRRQTVTVFNLPDAPRIPSALFWRD